MQIEPGSDAARWRNAGGEPLESTARVPFREALAVWVRIGLLSFGGPAGQIALMHRVLVEEKRWLDEPRFLHALNYCMLLPGPEAQQLATYTGWLLHGVRGGLAAGAAFLLPGALAMLGLSILYVRLGDLAPVEGLFFGLKAAVVAIVLRALVQIAARALTGTQHTLLALGAFLALWAFDVAFPLVVLAAGAIGYARARGFGSGTGGTTPVPAPAPARRRPRTARAALICLGLWAGTLLALALLLGGAHVQSRLAALFSVLATVSFGGAYAVLSWVAQQAVEYHQWLAPGEMLDGLGLAETTPGPLILVTQFVGFLAAYREAGGSGALLAGTLGAVLTTWVTFLPCFVWIFGGAPYVERLRAHTALAAGLSAVTAAVVGVIASLALWFATHFLFAEQVRIDAAGLALLLPVPATLGLPEAVLSAIALALVFGAPRCGVVGALGVTGLLGAGWHLLG